MKCYSSVQLGYVNFMENRKHNINKCKHQIKRYLRKKSKKMTRESFRYREIIIGKMGKIRESFI